MGYLEYNGGKVIEFHIMCIFNEYDTIFICD